MQVFYWTGPGALRDNKTYYQSFQLNGVDYTIGDTVYLFPEQENHPHYIGRIVSAFVDEHSGHADPHCIQVKWFERRVNLEESTRGIEESEKEVFELEDVDINPIGCISGKNMVIKSRCFDDAKERMRSSSLDWYFCRGYFIQTTNSFQPYTDVEMGTTGVARGRPGHAAIDEHESAPVHPAAINKNAQQSAGAKRKVTGRVCVQCGATSTPQWREGPTGPKTLCNACGVRYNRAQQKAQKRNQAATAGASSRGQAGRGAGGTSPGGRGKKGGVGATDVGGRADHRPVRQAAQVALARTSAYARTGEFPDQEPGLEGSDGMYGQPGALPLSSLDMQLTQGAAAPQDVNGAVLDNSLLYTGSQARTATEQAGMTPQQVVLWHEAVPGHVLGGLHDKKEGIPSYARGGLHDKKEQIPGHASGEEHDKKEGIPSYARGRLLDKTSTVPDSAAGVGHNSYRPVDSIPSGLLGNAHGKQVGKLTLQGAAHQTLELTAHATASKTMNMEGRPDNEMRGQEQRLSAQQCAEGQHQSQALAQQPAVTAVLHSMRPRIAVSVQDLQVIQKEPPDDLTLTTEAAHGDGHGIATWGQGVATGSKRASPATATKGETEARAAAGPPTSSPAGAIITQQASAATQQQGSHPAAGSHIHNHGILVPVQSSTPAAPHRIPVPVQSSTQAVPHATGLSSVQQPLHVQQVANSAQATAVHAALQSPELRLLQPLFARLEAATAGRMTPEVAQVLAAVRMKVDAAHNNAALAEAAASAVAQMYQARHEAAEHASQVAATARLQLQLYLASLTPAHAEQASAEVLSQGDVL